MAKDKFLIAPLNSGLQQNVRPWLIMDDAFARLRNAYNWRGIIRRRPGSIPMVTNISDANQQQRSRLRVDIGTTDGNGDLTVTSAAFPPGVREVGQIFSAGSEYYTVNVGGAPAALLSTGGGSATFDTTSALGNAFILTGGPATTDVYFYPSLPVMHFTSYENAAINNEETFAFDPQFAYSFLKTSGWTRLGTARWNGTDADFYSTTNFRGANAFDYLLFVVNNVVADKIKYWTGTAWAQINPVFTNGTPANVIETAQLVASFKDRLLLLNTTETTAAGTETYVNRVRFSQNGSPIQTEAFYDNIAGRGGFIEAPTREAIVGYEFVKDRLIVFFERSTYELAYTGNEILPFRFQKLDSELGVESQNSVIFFDKVALGFGSKGIHSCNGVNVERIDNLIPDTIYNIQNSENGPQRVTGIRDFDAEVVYWSYPANDNSGEGSEKFPNQILSYNYQNATWALFDDSITAFGYFQNNEDLTWNDLDVQWQESTDVWFDPSLQALYRNVLAGNQEGFVFKLDQNTTRNAASFQITDMAIVDNVITLTVINHNFTIGNFVYINNVQGDDASFDDFNNKIFDVNEVINEDEFTILLEDITGTYEGAGTIALVSPIQIVSKEYNFYNKIGQNMYIEEVQFYLDRQGSGVSVMWFRSSSSPVNIYLEGVSNETIPGDSLLTSFADPLNPLEQNQVQLWRNVYPYAEGQTISFEITEPVVFATGIDPNVQFSDFQLHAILFKVTPTYEL